MKIRGFLFLLGFTIFLMIMGIACNAPAATPTVEPTQQQLQPAPTQPSGSTNTPVSTDTSAPITFTDKSKFYRLQVPGNWIHITNSGTSVYIDQFKAPDGNALIESIVYNDGKPFSGAENGRFALYLLHQFYSSTGKEGDIHVSGDKILPDGRERLTWTSPGRGFSGLSYFEVRNNLNFLMFTLEWSDKYQSTYADTLDKIQTSYRSH